MLTSRWSRCWGAILVSCLTLFPSKAAGQGFGSVRVTPDGAASGTVNTSTNNLTASFIVKNMGMDPDFFSLTCSGTLGITCSVQGLSNPLDPYEEQSITVTFHTSSQTGVGTVTLSAFGFDYGGSDSGSRTYTINSPNPVQVTKVSVPATVLRYSVGNTGTFRVKNIGSSSQTFAVTCGWGGGDCNSSHDSTYLAAGDSQTVTVTFGGGPLVDSYTLDLEATASGYSSDASQAVGVTEVLFVSPVATRTPVWVAPGSDNVRDTFAVRAPGESVATYDMSVSCSGAIHNCSSLTSSAQIGDSSVNVVVEFDAGGNNTEGWLTLTATKSGQSGISAAGTLTVIATDQIQVDVGSANSGVEDIRGECLNIAAGAGAIVCDDFQYVYPLIPVTRLNRLRQTGLIYNSADVRGPKVVGADFVMPVGVNEGTSITATLTMAGSTVEQTYPSLRYAAGENTRLALIVDSTLLPSTAGLQKVDYSLQVRRNGSTSLSTTVDGELLLLDPDLSDLVGRGWWIAGLERLEVQHDTAFIIWKGPDGSGRVYEKTGSDTFLSVTRGRPDTITVTDSTYTRHLLGGGHVEFNAMGYHTKTVDRNGKETLFGYTSNRLASIQMPTPTSPDSVYKFTYDGNGYLDKVFVVDEAGGWGEYDVSVASNGELTAITAPDSLATTFGYVSGRPGLMESVVTPGAGTTSVSYDAWHATVDTVQVSADGETYSLAYQAFRLRGSDTGTGPHRLRHLDDVFVHLDGPRTDSADVTMFYLTGFGAVRGIEDAYGAETWIERGDPGFPALVTKVRAPNGHEILATYDSLGLLAYTQDRSTSGKVEYVWTDSLALLQSVTTAEGITTTFTYDSFGNRLTQTTDGKTTTFGYNSDGTVRWVVDPMNDTTRLEYDTAGNLAEEDPKGDGWTQYVRDSLGRVIVTRTAIDSTTSIQIDSTRVYFDEMGRDTLQVRRSTLDGGWQVVQTNHDSLGRRTKLTNLGSGAVISTDTVQFVASEWTYDGFGRVRTETGASKDSLVYDMAGNVTQRVTARGDVIEMLYDRVNRLVRRIVPTATYASANGTIRNYPYESAALSIPADTSVFAYDLVTGHLLSAHNQHAQTERAYDLSGRLTGETQRIRSYGGTGFSLHEYELGWDYDRDGRRIAIRHPSWLTSNPTTYDYNQAGQLESVVTPSGREVAFTYRDDGLLSGRNYPGGVTASYGYNDSHLVSSHSVASQSTTFLGYTVSYDWRGLKKTTSEASYDYDGLGRLVHSDIDLYPTEGPSVQRITDYRVDGLGRVYEEVVEEIDAASDITTTRNAFNDGRVATRTQQWTGSMPIPNSPDYWYGDDWSSSEDASGNVYMTGSTNYVYQVDTLGTPSLHETIRLRTYREESHSYFSADQKLRYHQVNRDTIGHNQAYPFTDYGPEYGAWEEYWYDALGRRVLVRSLQPGTSGTICERAGWCDSYIDRYVWDGEQVLWELRQESATGDVKEPSTNSLGGVIGYVHAGGIDAPIAMTRGSRTIFPHAEYRGMYATATDTAGIRVGCYPPTITSNCEDIAWPASSDTDGMQTDPRDVPLWYGSLIRNMEDASGLLYRRNRYYDPTTGQFTQEDPIGIAGGLNLYGYAGGDPINFSDPFGLCPVGKERTLDTSDCEDNAIGNALRVLDQYGGEVGASTLRAIVDNEIDIELATGADFMRQCGDFRNCFDRDRNTAIIQGGKNVVEYAPSIAHEVTHAILPAAVPYQFQEVMSVQRALDVFSGIPGGGAYSSYYARLLRDRTNNPSAFYLRVFNNALSEIGR